MPGGRKLSSGEQRGPAEQEVRAVMDGVRGRAGSQHIRCVQTAPSPPMYRAFFSFSSLEFHPVVQTTPNPGRAEGVRKFVLGSPKAPEKPPRVKGQVSPPDLRATLRRKAPSEELT